MIGCYYCLVAPCSQQSLQKTLSQDECITDLFHRIKSSLLFGIYHCYGDVHTHETEIHYTWDLNFRREAPLQKTLRYVVMFVSQN